MPIPVQCSHCEAVLTLKDAAKDSLGKKMRCPKCGEVFVTKRYRTSEPEEVEDIDFAYDADDDVDDYDEPPRRSANAKRGTTSRSRSGVGRKSAGANQLLIIVLSVLGGFLLLLGVGLFLWMRARVDVAPASVPAAQEMPVANNSTPLPGAAPAPTSVVPAVDAAAISDAEYDAFAKALEEKVALERGLGLTSLLNTNMLLDRSLLGLALDPKFVVGFRIGIATAFTKSFAAELDKTLNANGHYRLIRRHGEGAHTRLLFRMAGDNGMNYHDLEVVRGSNGVLEIVDMHIALSGERLSESIRRMTVLTALGQKGSFLQQLTGQLSDIEKSAPLIDRVNAQKASGQFAQALATLKQLPPSVQSEKTFALMRVMIAMQINEQEYLSAMTDFRKTFPTDACIDFLSIDFYILRKEYDQGIAAIDRFDKSIGGDVYLNTLRANIYGEQKKWAEARKAIALVIAAEPTLPNPVFAQAGIGILQPDFKLVLDSLRILKNQHKLDLSGVEDAPEYADFVKSPEYQEWKREM